MAREGHRIETIIGKLREIEVVISEGRKVPDACPLHGSAFVARSPLIGCRIVFFCLFLVVTRAQALPELSRALAQRPSDLRDACSPKKNEHDEKDNKPLSGSHVLQKSEL